MSELPPGWISAPVKDLGELRLGKMLDKARNRGLPASYLRNINVRWFHFDVNETHTLLASPEEMKELSVEDGDLFICKGGEPGRCAVWRGGENTFVYQKALHRFRGYGAMVPELLMYRMRYEADAGTLAEAFTGTTIKHLTRESLASISIPVPPISEQKRIAAKVHALLARVATCRECLNRVTEILKRFRQSVLAAATTGDLTKDWRNANAGRTDATPLAAAVDQAHSVAGGHKAGNAALPTEGVHDLEASSFPSSWAIRTLRDLVMPDRPITYGILKPGPELEVGVYYIRVADYPGNELNRRTLRRTSPKIDEEFKRARLRSGDILLSIRGTVGRTMVVPADLEGANITQDTARLTIQDVVNHDYVLWYLRSELTQRRMSKAMKGVAVRGINIGDVRALQVPLPSRDEQDEIVKRVEALFAFAGRIETRLKAALELVGKLTPATLAKAFRGELIPQDPNDEPASTLLARIRAARGNETSRKPRSSRKATGTSPISKSEIAVLTWNEVKANHLSSILKKQGPLKAEELWRASQLGIDDFYDVLKEEEAKGLLRENQPEDAKKPRTLEAA